MKYLFLILLALSVWVSCSDYSKEPPELEFLTVRIEKELDNLYAALENHVDDYSLQTDSTYIVNFLNDIYKSNRHVRATSYVNHNGVLQYSVPMMSDVRGIDISYQEHVKYVLDNHEPVLGKQFRAVQGFNAVTITEPVLDSDSLHSFFSILISPQYLINDIVEDYPYLDSCDVWVIEKDGTIIYDKHIEEIGKNVINDCEYDNLREFDFLLDSVTGNKSGFLVYSPADNKKQNVVWRTVEFFESEWIVVVEFPCGEEIYARTPDILGIPSSEEALINLSEKELFLDFLADADHRSMGDMMKNFYDKCPGIFAIQWIDSSGTNQIGFPLYNLNYLGHQIRNTCKSPNILYALEHRTIYNFDEDISEDYFASFYSVPLYRDKKYLGLLYYAELHVK